MQTQLSKLEWSTVVFIGEKSNSHLLGFYFTKVKPCTTF